MSLTLRGRRIRCLNIEVPLATVLGLITYLKIKDWIFYAIENQMVGWFWK